MKTLKITLAVVALIGLIIFAIFVVGDPSNESGMFIDALVLGGVTGLTVFIKNTIKEKKDEEEEDF